MVPSNTARDQLYLLLPLFCIKCDKLFHRVCRRCCAVSTQKVPCPSPIPRQRKFFFQNKPLQRRSRARTVHDEKESTCTWSSELSLASSQDSIPLLSPSSSSSSEGELGELLKDSTGSQGEFGRHRFKTDMAALRIMQYIVIIIIITMVTITIMTTRGWRKVYYHDGDDGNDDDNDGGDGYCGGGGDGDDDSDGGGGDGGHCEMAMTTVYPLYSGSESHGCPNSLAN